MPLRLRSFVAYLVVWILSLGWFAFFQSWGGFNDPDDFYHAKIASVMSVQGPLHAFPWLDLTLFDKGFSDHHLLFHLLLIPFIRWWGCCDADCRCCVRNLHLVLYACLRRLTSTSGSMDGSRRALLSAFVRLSLAKASPLALVCSFWGSLDATRVVTPSVPNAGLGSWEVSSDADMLCPMEVGHCSHRAGVVLMGAACVDRFVLDRPWRASLRNVPWIIFVATMVERIGTLIHNFPQNIF